MEASWFYVMVVPLHFTRIALVLILLKSFLRVIGSVNHAAVKFVAATEEKIEDQIIFIAETNRLPQAEAFKKLIEERFKPKEILITDVCPTCGVNVGPGLMAAYYMGKPISADLSEERAIIEKSLAAK